MPDKKFSRFFIIWIGQFISSIGSGLTAFALGIYAFRLTHSATSFSLIILFSFLPSIILKPIGGTFADRINRRLLMIIGDGGSALGLLFILLMFVSEIGDLWVIYAGVAFSSVFVALQDPAYRATITDLLDKDSYSKASGLAQFAESSRYLISPIIAGFLLEFMQVKDILIIDILTFLVAILFVFLIKRNLVTELPEEKKPFLPELKEGFRYTTANKGLLWLLTLSSLVTFGIGFLQSLLGPMILYFADSNTLGIIQTISASGMLVSSFFIGVFGKLKKYILILSFGLGFAGIFYAMLGVSTNVYFIVSAGFLFFFTLPFINTGFDVLIRKNADNEIQGRVWSIVSLISQLGMIVAFAIAGFLADYIFIPLLNTNGMLAPSIGKLIGTGQGRGIGFMFVIFGLFVSVIALIIGKIKSIKELEKQI